MNPDTGIRMPNLNKMHRDEKHPKRLASIIAGENAADQINIIELGQRLNQ